MDILKFLNPFSMKSCLLIKLLVLHTYQNLLTYQVSALDSNEELKAKVQSLREQIKLKIYPNSSLVHNYIHDDLYIYWWLHKNNFHVEKTNNDFMEHLDWRKKEKIDRIDKEDWRFYKAEYPQFSDTFDKYGRPVAEVWISEWNVRRTIVIGQKNRRIRWTTYLLEMTERRLYQTRSDKSSRNVTQAVEIIDLEGFSTILHGCFNCVTVYTRLATTCGQHYPGLWKSVHMVNVGPAFRMMLNIGRDFNYAQKNQTTLYSQRNEWLPVLDKEISNDQRSLRFGGSIERKENN